jgi:hypothetical protein
MEGATIIPRSLKTTRNEKNFQDRPNFFTFFKSYMTLKYLLLLDFPKFDPLKGLSHEIDFKNFDKNLQNLT